MTKVAVGAVYYVAEIEIYVTIIVPIDCTPASIAVDGYFFTWCRYLSWLIDGNFPFSFRVCRILIQYGFSSISSSVSKSISIATLFHSLNEEERESFVVIIVILYCSINKYAFSVVLALNSSSKNLLHWMMSRQCIWHHYKVIYSDGILYDQDIFSLRPGKNQHVKHVLFFFVISIWNNFSHSTEGCVVSADVVDWNKWKNRELCHEQIRWVWNWKKRNFQR